MEMTALGKTGLTVSRAVLGTMTFGNQADEGESASMLDLALERGVNFIDTANVYNNGESERVLGKFLGGRRDRVVLATKVGLCMGDGLAGSGLSRAAIEKQLDESLRRLNTDHVDLYYLHLPDPKVPIAESLETMSRLVEAGKVRLVGTSNYAAWQVVQTLWIAQESGLSAPTVAQPMYNLLARGIEQEFLPMCREFQTAVVAYNPLAGGLLTGKHRPEAPLTGSRFDRNAAYRDRYWHQANFEAVQQLAKVAQSLGRTLVSMSLRWLMDRPEVSGVILGASKLAQLQQNLDSLEEGPLPEEATEECDRIWGVLRGVSPKYNR